VSGELIYPRTTELGQKTEVESLASASERYGCREEGSDLGKLLRNFFGCWYTMVSFSSSNWSSPSSIWR